MILAIFISIMIFAASAVAADITKISDFNSLIFTPDAYTTQWLYGSPHTPPDVPIEGGGYVRVKYQVGNTWADLEKYYSGSIDLSGKYLHIDVWAEGYTTGQDNLSPTIKLKSGNKIVLEANKAVRNGQWTGLNFDISSLNQQQLASINYIDIYLADSINPSMIYFRLDDLYASKQPFPKTEKTQFIIAGILKQLELNGTIPAQDYSQLQSQNIDLYMRTMEYDRYAGPITAWDQTGTKYYFTAASSDFVNSQGQPLYVPYNPQVYEVLSRSACKGVYLHEMVTLMAADNSWNWDQAVNAIDWTWLNNVVSRAKSLGKRVIWSEPAGGWQALMNNSYARSRLLAYGNTVVPMFATNFHCESSGYLMGQSRDYAGAAAGMMGTVLGESHQSWYFEDQNTPVTIAGSLWLGKIGRDHKARIFQFEGQQMDMYWDEDGGSPYISEYMQGVRDFAAWINAGN